MKHLVTLEFHTIEKLYAFLADAGLVSFRTNGSIVSCVLTFKEVELAKQYGAKELAEA